MSTYVIHSYPYPIIVTEIDKPTYAVGTVILTEILPTSPPPPAQNPLGIQGLASSEW